MKVIVATDGSLNARKAAKASASLAGKDGEVIVLTVIEVPRQMLEAMRAASGLDSEKFIFSNVEFGETESDTAPARGWIGDDAVISRYIEDQREARTSAIAEELATLGVANVRTLCNEGENVAAEILSVAATEKADVICIGTLGLGRFEGLLGSISTKVARRADCSVMLLR